MDTFIRTVPKQFKGAITQNLETPFANYCLKLH